MSKHRAAPAAIDTSGGGSVSLADGSASEPADVSGAALGSLGSRVRRGALWSGANTLALRFGNIVLMAIVVRLVTPHEFGVFAVAITVHAVIANVSALGVIAVLTRADTDADAIGPTVKTVTILSSGGLAAIMYLLAPWLAPALGSAEAVDAIRVMSLAVFMIGVFAVPGAMLAREFRQDRIFFANMIAFVPSNAVLLLLAVSGDGALAFAWSRVVGQVIAGGYMAYSVKRRYGFGLDRKQLAFVLSVGLPLAGADLVNVVLLNADFAFVGRLLGPERLGIYALAFNVANWTTWLLGAMVNSVAMPAFSRVKDNAKQLGAALVRASRLVALLAWPACAISFASARPLVETIYGSHWTAASVVLAILAPYAVLLTHTLVFSNLLAGTGHGAALLRIQLVWLAALVPSMVLGVHLGGTTGVAIAHVAVIALIVIPAYLIVIKRLMGVSAHGIGLAVLPAVLSSVVAALVDFGVSSLIESAPLKLLLGAIAGGLAYLLMMAHQLQSLLPAASGSERKPIALARSGFTAADRPRRTVLAMTTKWSRPEVVRGMPERRWVDRKAEDESDGCAIADDDNAASRRLGPADPGRTSGRDH